MRSAPHSLVARQRGAAALIVVMVLFFVMSMVAAYTNRNLIFEQRTAANLQRSTRALEAAEAGIEWALTMLNKGRIDATCGNSTSLADTTFRERYLDINGDTGFIVPRKRTAAPNDHLYPTCVYNGATWDCSCPVDADPAVATPGGTSTFPAFRVRFRRVCGATVADSNAADLACADPFQPGIVHIDVNGCTTLAENCLAFPTSPGVDGEAKVTAHVVAALTGGLPALPSAALTVGNAVAAQPTLQVTNSEILGSGVTIHAGGTVSGTPLLQGKAGTPAERTVVDSDAFLLALSTSATPPERMFVNSFGMWKITFAEQPAAIELDCTGGCGASTLRNKIDLNPGRPFWIRGNISLDGAGDIGTATQPVLLNVTGNVTFGSNVTVYGLINSQAATWALSGTGAIIGGAIAEGGFSAAAGTSTDIRFDRSVLTRLRNVTGSFVRIPGTWRDFE